ncbi:MAG: GGDEF domain-containing protein [bacterium]|nr:GGDEF domain-containing protein [bacterium]
MRTFPEKTVFDDEIADQLGQTTRTWTERPVLIPLDGKETEQRHRIDRRELTLGREANCDIVLNDAKCSRAHARLIYHNFDHVDQPPDILLADLGSTNGTFVNGVRIKQHHLQDRDKILLGSTLLGFFLRDTKELDADQRLYFMANNDALTGLYNRAVFNRELQREFERSRRYGRELSLVIFDIDHFKQCNDNYGHLMGDFALQEIGRLVAGNIRGNDIAVRYGGEEFAIILPETNLEGALIQGERIREAVANHLFTKDSTTFRLTISLGIAAIEPDMAAKDQLLKSADMALYTAKDTGRNRVCCSRDGRLTNNETTRH